VGRGRFELP